MKKILISSALCASMLFAASSDYKYEITPLISSALVEGNLDMEKGYYNAGLAVGFNLEDSMFNQVEVGFLRTIEDVDYIWRPTPTSPNYDTGVTRVFTNLVKEYPIWSDMSIYTLIGAGVEIFDDERYGNENGLFGNYGVGFKFALPNDMSLKVDYRHLIETDHGDNSLISTIGLSIPFGKKAVEAPVVKEEPKTVVIVEEEEIVAIDSDGDGVADMNDKCPDTPKGDIVDQNGCSLKVDLNINFAFDSAIINNSYDSKIKKFADFMKAFPAVKAKIEAYTDSVGTTEYNQDLSEKRAASTVKALEAYGIEKSRVKSIGYGESRPIATNETAEGRAANRRVEGSIQK
ncbi:MAG: OmpA family protein [Halarcobacter sp.]